MCIILGGVIITVCEPTETITPIGPITEDEDITKKIFNHLLMFQYLQDLKKHDEHILSTFKSVHSVVFSEHLKVDFLNEWSREKNLGVKQFLNGEETITIKKFADICKTSLLCGNCYGASAVPCQICIKNQVK